MSWCLRGHGTLGDLLHDGVLVQEMDLELGGVHGHVHVLRRDLDPHVHERVHPLGQVARKDLVDRLFDRGRVDEPVVDEDDANN